MCLPGGYRIHSQLLEDAKRYPRPAAAILLCVLGLLLWSGHRQWAVSDQALGTISTTAADRESSGRALLTDKQTPPPPDQIPEAEWVRVCQEARPAHGPTVPDPRCWWSRDRSRLCFLSGPYSRLKSVPPTVEHSTPHFARPSKLRMGHRWHPDLGKELSDAILLEDTTDPHRPVYLVQGIEAACVEARLKLWRAERWQAHGGSHEGQLKWGHVDRP